MEKLDRIQQLHQIFTSHRHPIKLRELAARLECTEKTVRRLIDVMQTFLFAPIENVKDKGWAYVNKPDEHFQLPGLWLTANELQSMALLLNVLANFGNGLLNDELQAVEQEVYKLLRSRKISPETLVNRIKVLPLGNRSIPNETFLRVGDALLKTRQITFRYLDYKQKQTTRTVSPQSLLYYRDNWYLDAWCHQRNALRIFSLARIERVLDTGCSAKLVAPEDRDEYFACQTAPNPEFPTTVLMNSLYSNLHKALHDLSSRSTGVSFPCYRITLGNLLRVHSTVERLNELQQLNWIRGMGGYCDVAELKPVPCDVQFRTVSRKQTTMSQSKLRRLIKRGSIPDDKITQYSSKMVTKDLNNPYVELLSGSNGNKHRRYIEFGELLNNPVSGEFDQFGLSKTATIPWFD